MSDSTLAHRAVGAGDPLLLLNGIAMSISSWEPVAAPLTERFRVIRCDFRGQLLSPGMPPADVGEHVDDVVRLLDHIELESVAILSTSFGGAVGALLAARHPERVRALISVASGDGFDNGMATEVTRWRDATVLSLQGDDRGHLSDVLEPVVYSSDWIDGHREDRALRRRQIASLPDSWFEGLVGLLDSAESYRLGDELSSIQCPALIVAAELDGFIPTERSRALAERIPGAVFKEIKGAGHAVVVERPDEIVRLCLEFLDSPRGEI